MSENDQLNDTTDDQSKLLDKKKLDNEINNMKISSSNANLNKKLNKKIKTKIFGLELSKIVLIVILSILTILTYYITYGDDVGCPYLNTNNANSYENQNSILNDPSILRSFTTAELFKYRGLNDGEPIYIGFRCNVYDVSDGAIFYAENSSYGMLAGKDASRAFVTGCFDEVCLISNYQDLQPDKIQQAFDQWGKLYGSKYPQIGVLVDCVNTDSEIELAKEAELKLNSK